MSQLLEKILAPIPEPVTEELTEIRVYYRDVARRLQATRKMLGLTQHDLGHHVGLSRSTIANIETGNQKCPLHFIHYLSQLGVPKDVQWWIVTGDDGEELDL